jgi:cytochrome c peroxidase
MPSDAAAVARGQAIFNDPSRAACVTCHTGARLTNNQSVDVGTGGTFQVPSLVGISTRGPFMHNGCAETLRDRFDPACGGGDRHGATSKLQPSEVTDLVQYLETL